MKNYFKLNYACALVLESLVLILFPFLVMFDDSMKSSNITEEETTYNTLMNTTYEDNDNPMPTIENLDRIFVKHALFNEETDEETVITEDETTTIIEEETSIENEPTTKYVEEETTTVIIEEETTATYIEEETYNEEIIEEVPVETENIVMNNYTEDELYWLSNIIYCEAGDCSREMQLYVGSVVLNRVASEDFPNTIYSVIFQKGQYAPVISGKIYNETPSKLSIEVAIELLTYGSILPKDVIYQANFVQGSSIYASMKDGPYQTMYFCYK